MTYQTDDRARMRRQNAERAIKLAMESKWEEAAQVNRTILAAFPNDVDAHNRLGKALTELGRYREARASYARTVELDPANAIAKKNLSRLQALGDVEESVAEGQQKADPDLFIEETGKTGTTQLLQPERDALRRMTAGDLVILKQTGNQLQVTDSLENLLGVVEPRLALRLINFMKSGNQYAAGVASVAPGGDNVRIIIKETFQSSENAGKLSFPPTTLEGFRPYTKEGLVRYDLDEEDSEVEDLDESDEWGTAEDSDDSNEVSFDLRRSAESRTNDDEEGFD